MALCRARPPRARSIQSQKWPIPILAEHRPRMEGRRDDQCDTKPLRAALHQARPQRQRRDRRQRSRASRQTRFPCGLELRNFVPQGHKVALADIPEGAPIRRYNEVIGNGGEADPGRRMGRRGAHPDADAARTRQAPSWQHLSPRRSRRWKATPSRATATPTARSARGTSWPSAPACSAWPARCDFAVKRIKAELLPQISQRRRRGRR